MKTNVKTLLVGAAAALGLPALVMPGSGWAATGPGESPRPEQKMLQLAEMNCRTGIRCRRGDTPSRPGSPRRPKRPERPSDPENTPNGFRPGSPFRFNQSPRGNRFNELSWIGYCYSFRLGVVICPGGN